MKRTIQEHRLSKGLTIQAASKLSGISSANIKRWEKNGCGRADAFLVWDLLNSYGTKIEFIDSSRTATDKQRLEAMLTGSCTAMPSGKIEVDLDKLITLMKSEGCNVSELEAICRRDKTKRPAVSSSVSA